MDRSIVSTFNDIHSEAMDLTYYALKARRRGDVNVALDLFAKALKLERAALDVMGDVGEPIYSTMYRSAATLALDCNDFRLAEKLASKALAGDPPPYLVWQLREVVERAKFGTHLDLVGVELGPEEIQLSVAGGAVGYGEVLYDDFMPRVDGTRKLINRVWDYEAGRGHAEQNGSPEVSHARLPLVMSVPREGSMAVTLKIGTPRQPALPEVLGTADVIAKSLDVIETVASSEDEELATAYPDETYRRNFVQLVKLIAPDGDRVTQVGFTTVRLGAERKLPLTTTKSELNRYSRPTSPEAREETITGRLLFADGMGKLGQSIKILQADGTECRIKVPAGMMDDIVRPLWNQEVIAVCTVKGKTTTLVEVEGA